MKVRLTASNLGVRDRQAAREHADTTSTTQFSRITTVELLAPESLLLSVSSAITAGTSSSQGAAKAVSVEQGAAVAATAQLEHATDGAERDQQAAHDLADSTMGVRISQEARHNDTCGVGSCTQIHTYMHTNARG